MHMSLVRSYAPGVMDTDIKALAVFSENMKRTLARKICQQTSLLSGFGDTHGTSFVVEIFNKYLEIQDLNPFRLTVTDQAINDFVDFFLAQETGRLCQSEDG